MDPLEAHLRECFGRVAYSHKTHEKCADNCQKTLSRIKLGQIALAALTTGGIFTAIFAGVSSATNPQVELYAKIAAAVLSTVLLILNAYTKDVDPGRLSERHREAATALWNIRESYVSLLADFRSNAITADQARIRRDSLQEALCEIYRAAPRTTSQAYAAAQDGLQRNQELTFSDEEIDKLLPGALRKATE
ncbi:MAG: SLATT domain-containing protein [Pseudomonadota bacterium]